MIPGDLNLPDIEPTPGGMAEGTIRKMETIRRNLACVRMALHAVGQMSSRHPSVTDEEIRAWQGQFLEKERELDDAYNAVRAAQLRGQ